MSLAIITKTMKTLKITKIMRRVYKMIGVATGNRTAGVPKISYLSGILTNARGALMLRQASLVGSAISIMTPGVTAITPRLLCMFCMVAMMGWHARETLMPCGGRFSIT